MTKDKDYSDWNRKLLNYLWISVILTVVVPIINFHYVDKEKFTLCLFLIDRVLKPTAIIVVFMLCLEYLIRKNYSQVQYFLISVVAIIANLLMYIHIEAIHAILPVYTIPIFISVFTRESRKIKFAFGISLFSFFMLNIFVKELDFDKVELISFTAILFSAYVLGIEIIKRYEEINEDLKIAISNEKELFYKTIYMEKLSKTDLATNLYNHRTFHEYLEKLFSHYEEEEFELHLALFDLDKFKDINDTYGHSVGDLVIERSAKLIKENISANDFAARYGGEEFAVIFTEKSAHEIIDLLEKIRKKIENLIYEEMDGKNVTVSIGFSSANESKNKEEIFKKADSRLYIAKSNGRNRLISSN